MGTLGLLFYILFAAKTASIMETMNIKEVIKMDVEKTIRILGYIVYTALWAPVVVVGLVILPIVYIVMLTRAGMTTKEAAVLYKKALKSSFQHDVNFIKTGTW